MSRGAVSFWSRPTDTGRTLACAFCPGCGSRLWHQAADPADPLSVKGGSLDAPLDLSAAVHIWTVRKLPGVLIPASARRFPAEPD